MLGLNSMFFMSELQWHKEACFQGYQPSHRDLKQLSIKSFSFTSMCCHKPSDEEREVHWISSKPPLVFPEWGSRLLCANSWNLVSCKELCSIISGSWGLHLCSTLGKQTNQPTHKPVPENCQQGKASAWQASETSPEHSFCLQLFSVQEIAPTWCSLSM